MQSDSVCRNVVPRQRQFYVYLHSGQHILKPHGKWDLRELDDGSAYLYFNFWLLHYRARTQEESRPSAEHYAHTKTTHTHTHTHTRIVMSFVNIPCLTLFPCYQKAAQIIGASVPLWYRHSVPLHTVKKVKQSHYRPGQTLMIPEV